MKALLALTRLLASVLASILRSSSASSPEKSSPESQSATSPTGDERMGAYRCSTCALNYPTIGTCTVCGGGLDWISRETETPNLAEEVSRRLEMASLRVTDDATKTKNWRQEQLLAAGYPWDYAVGIAKDREIDLHLACQAMRDAEKKYGPKEGLELVLELLL